MNFFFILIYILLFLNSIYPTYSDKMIDIYKINDIWDSNRDSSYGIFQIKNLVNDSIYFQKSIIEFNYYKKLIEHLSKLNRKYNIIRLINRYSESSSLIDYGSKDTIYFNSLYKPQAYFLYKFFNEDDIHLVFINKNCNVEDKIIKPNFDFEYLINSDNYKDFLSEALIDYFVNGIRSKGSKICISLYNNNNCFSVTNSLFWKYGNGKIEEFYSTTGSDKTTKELQKLLTQLYEMGVIQDEVFELECK